MQGTTTKAQEKVATDLLGDQIAEMAAHIDAAMHRLLTAIREFDAASGWYAQGARSCAHWLAWRIGWDLTTARERLRVARRLAELPIVDEQLRLGAMSYSRARAISRVANSENEKLWVEYAKRMPASSLDKLCRSYQSVQQSAGPTSDAADKRSVVKRLLDDGMIRIEIVLPRDEAMTVWAVINSAAKSAAPPAPAPVPAPETSAEVSRRARAMAAQRADAVMAIANERARGDRPNRTPIEVLVTVPVAGLHTSAEASAPGAPSDIAMTAEGEALAPATIQRLCCDAGIVVASVDQHGEPLSVGRKTRTISAAIKRALLLRDGSCRFPGCTNRHFVDGHHVEHWARGGKTALSNLMLLCSAHHRLLHEGGFSVVADATDGWHFFDQRNRSVLPQPARVPFVRREPARDVGLATLRANNAALAITAETNEPMWTGEPIDYGTCIDYLV